MGGVTANARTGRSESAICLSNSTISIPQASSPLLTALFHLICKSRFL
jgi:hypothetical protein